MPLDPDLVDRVRRELRELGWLLVTARDGECHARRLRSDFSERLTRPSPLELLSAVEARELELAGGADAR